ncbi:MAG: CCA tRNA nucleotidyltransferase [Hyphomonadaceae bacterium]|nr:CCA tRNA nucleotidyltransferase [Hyphomonadaceae bacterium]
MTTLNADWLTAAPTRRVIEALHGARPDAARFVGGCVRNTIMARPVDDIDIATQLRPEETLAALERAKIRAIPTGIDHGTVTAVVDHQPFEITSLRRDVETDGRRAVVAFTDDWTEDAQRRDFRLNALYAAPDGEVFDPVGGGVDDALAGRVIFIGDADERLREDYLRILRFFRFNAWYGAGIDADGRAACERQRSGLAKIARERIWKELKKLLAAEMPRRAVEAMGETGVLDAVLPEHRGADGLHDLELTEQLTGVQPDPMLRLMALLPRSALAVQQTGQALRLSNEEAGRLTMWAADNLPEPVGMKSRELRATLYWHGKQAVVDRAMLAGADVRDLLAAVRAWRRPEFPINGDDALAAGLKGKDIGEALSRVARVWVDSDFDLERPALLDLLVQQQD